ncbi:cytochrome P450 [soil metagenome]
MSDKPAADWDPRDASVLSDQRSAYDEMRERCPVAHSDFLDWSVFRHKDIVSVLADPETYSSASRRRAVPNGMDAPEHTLYRRALEPCFDREQMATFEPRCRSGAVEMVQDLLTRDEVEFVSEFAQPFSVETLCAFLGWPQDTREQLSVWIHDNQQAAFSHDRETGKTLALAFIGYVKDALRVRRETGVGTFDDITASLMMTEVEGEPLSDDDIASVLRNWTAGHGTVAAALGILALYLAEHQDVQQQLCDEPALLPAAIDEILRGDGPLVANRRTTTREVEIGGRTVGAGETLTLIWIAANRDGRVFDNPDTVRFHQDHETNIRDRGGNNLVFGAGIHDCLGAPLASLEMRVAMEELLNCTSRIEHTGTQPPSRGVYPSNGPEALKIRLS